MPDSTPISLTDTALASSTAHGIAVSAGPGQVPAWDPNFTWDPAAQQHTQKGQAAGTGGDRWRLQDNAGGNLAKYDANGTLVHDLTVNPTTLVQSIVPAHNTGYPVVWAEGSFAVANAGGGTGTYNFPHYAGWNTQGTGPINPSYGYVARVYEPNWWNPGANGGLGDFQREIYDTIGGWPGQGATAIRPIGYSVTNGLISLIALQCSGLTLEDEQSAYVGWQWTNDKAGTVSWEMRNQNATFWELDSAAGGDTATLGRGDRPATHTLNAGSIAQGNPSLGYSRAGVSRASIGLDSADSLVIANASGTCVTYRTGSSPFAEFALPVAYGPDFDSAARMQITPVSTGEIGLLMKGLSGQTADLVDIYDNLNRLLFQVPPTGPVMVGQGQSNAGINFGGALSASFPQIVRSGTGLVFQLSDASNFAFVTGNIFKADEGNTSPMSGFIADDSVFHRVGLMKYPGLEGALTAGSGTLLRIGHRTDSTNVDAGGTATFRWDLTFDNSTGNASFTGAAGFNGATPPAKAASPGVATGTDAAVINAQTTILRNLGLCS